MEYNLNPNVFKLLKKTLRNKECVCFQNKYLKLKQGFNDPNISNSMRISQIINSNLGGRITFINSNFLNDNLGYIEGQSGGSFKYLRNKF